MHVLSDLLFQGEDLLQGSAAPAAKGLAARGDLNISPRQQQEGRAFASAFDAASRTEISADSLTDEAVAPGGVLAAETLEILKPAGQDLAAVDAQISPAVDHAVKSSGYALNDQGFAIAALRPTDKSATTPSDVAAGTVMADTAKLVVTSGPSTRETGAKPLPAAGKETTMTAPPIVDGMPSTPADIAAADLGGTRKNDRADIAAPVAPLERGFQFRGDRSNTGKSGTPSDAAIAALKNAAQDKTMLATNTTGAAKTVTMSLGGAPISGQSASPVPGTKLPSVPFDVTIVTPANASEKTARLSAAAPAGLVSQTSHSQSGANMTATAGSVVATTTTADVTGTANLQPMQELPTSKAASTAAAPAPSQADAPDPAALNAATETVTGPVAPKTDTRAMSAEPIETSAKTVHQAAAGQTDAQLPFTPGSNAAAAPAGGTLTGIAKMISDPAIQSQALQQVASAIEASHKGSGRMELRLDPPELGRVSIDFRFDGDSRVTAILHADQPETATLMRRSLDILMRDLASAGFTDVNVTMGSGGRDAGQTGQQTGQQAGQHQAERQQQPGNQYGSARERETQAQNAPQAYRPAWSADTIDIRL